MANKSSEAFIKETYSKRKGKIIKTKDISGKGRTHWKIEKLTLMPQTNHNEKVYVIERLRRIKTEGIIARPDNAVLGEMQYRIGYYIVGRIGNKNQKWTWGNMLPL